MFQKIVLNCIFFSAAWALFVLMISVTPIEAQPQIVINEILYAPVSPEPEWIEFFNPGASNVDLTKWKISTLTKTDSLPISSISANGYIVITKDSTNLRAKRPGSYIIVQCNLPPLVNTGDVIALKDSSLRFVDSLYYMPSWGGSKGQSLERKNSLGSSTNSSNWGTSIDPSGATPGLLNSLSAVSLGSYDLAIDSLHHYFSDDTINIIVQISNKGNFTIDSSILSITADTGRGPALEFSTILGAVDSGSSITEKIIIPNVSYRAINYSVFITSAHDTTHSDDTIHFYVPLGIKPLSIVINEIMFAPVSLEPEWIELLNTSKDTIDIDSFGVAVQHYSMKTIMSGNTVIPPDSMVVITSNATALANARHIPLNKIVNIALSDLSNSGSTIALSDERGDLIDSAVYAGNWIKKSGISVERIDALQPGYDSSNWKACEDTIGSTILRPNSVRQNDYDIALINPKQFDDSIQFTIINVGKDTLHNTSVVFIVGTIDTIEYPISCNLPSRDSLKISFAVPQNFFGLFPALAYVEDTLDERHSNDSISFNIALEIPQDSLVINEIMFYPKTNSCQWIELDNLSTRLISMDSTRLLIGESKPGLYSFTIPPLLIAADSFGLVSANDSIFQSWPRLEGKIGTIVPNDIGSLNKSTLDLGRDSSFVVLHNYDSSTIDSVHYFKSWQSSLIVKNFAGISLERKDPRESSNDASNWQACLDTSGGTPLAPNSVSTFTNPIPPPSQTFQATFDPNPFSPDGDGFQDISTLTVQTGDASIWTLRVRIFDARGNAVRTLTDAATVVSGITLTFDGKRDNGQTLPPGIYAALIELTSQSPLQSLKKTIGVAIAGKRR